MLGVDDSLAASIEDAIRRFFVAPPLELLARHPGYHIQSSGEFLIVAVDGIAPTTDRPALWHEAAGLRRALLSLRSNSEDTIPAVPGMDIGRQRARRDGHNVGCLAGAALGFFIGFIVHDEPGLRVVHLSDAMGAAWGSVIDDRGAGRPLFPLHLPEASIWRSSDPLEVQRRSFEQLRFLRI